MAARPWGRANTPPALRALDPLHAQTRGSLGNHPLTFSTGQTRLPTAPAYNPPGRLRDEPAAQTASFRLTAGALVRQPVG